MGRCALLLLRVDASRERCRTPSSSKTPSRGLHFFLTADPPCLLGAPHLALAGTYRLARLGSSCCRAWVGPAARGRPGSSCSGWTPSLPPAPRPGMRKRCAKVGTARCYLGRRPPRYLAPQPRRAAVHAGSCTSQTAHVSQTGHPPTGCVCLGLGLLNCEHPLPDTYASCSPRLLDGIAPSFSPHCKPYPSAPTRQLSFLLLLLQSLQTASLWI